jgi:coenzyme F420 biosynthesis associated uncharacterized protein
MAPKIARNLIVGLVSGAALALVVEATRPLGGRQPLLEWDRIRDLTLSRLTSRPLHEARLQMLSAEYNRLADEVREPLLAEVGQLPKGQELPPFQALDQQGWLDLNVGIARRVMQPLVEVSMFDRSHLTDLGKAGIERYMAFLLATLASRVLGQFDPQLQVVGGVTAAEGAAEPAHQALYLVEPNVAAWEASAGLDGADLRRWLILHELTHAWQFAAHPWLRGHLNAGLERMIELAAAQGGGASVRNMFRLTFGVPEQWRLIRQIQATMSLIEGYGNLVMNEVGRKVLPSFEQLEAAYRRRSRTTNVLEDLLWRVSGLELKMQQYKTGEAFAQYVHDVWGMEVLNLAWTGPETLPRHEELRDPQRWYRRVVGDQRHPALALA